MTDHLNGESLHYPYTAVCEVVAKFPDGTIGQGSGVMVSANDVLTASHVLWDVDHGGAATAVTVYAGRDGGGSIPFGAKDATQWFYYQIDDKGGQLTQAQDWQDVGIVSLSGAECLGLKTGYFGLDWGATSGNYHLTGYPTIYGPDRMCEDYGYAIMDGRLSTFDIEGGGIEAHDGNSGGPLWYMDAAGHPYVVGVCSTAAWATDILQAHDQILSWMHADGIW